ncbi:MAG: hypothetical protein KGZ81_10925 [Flavobacteriales bacterium]|nr:hypothetical protein [Flavobacteriales bacterium]
MKLIKTPFLLVIGALCGILLILSIHHLLIEHNGGKALGGTIAFIGLLLLCVILFIEQWILNKYSIPIKAIWIIEISIIVFLGIYTYFVGFSIG